MAVEYKIGDCLELMKELQDNSVDSIVTDPPYGIHFMAKKWDYDIPTVDVWKECLRVLKPGGHILVACGTRTQHRMAVNIEDAGFEIRDIISWLYGSGFPKSMNIGKAVDKLQGNEREVVGEKNLWGHNAGSGAGSFSKNQYEGTTGITRTEPLTQGNSEWEGWGTALKPAQELWTLARKPLSEKSIAKNVLKWGTGGINIDDCRVPMEPQDKEESKNNWKPEKGYDTTKTLYKTGIKSLNTHQNKQGRFPANVIHDGSDEVVGLFPDSKGQQGDVKGNEPSEITQDIYGKFKNRLPAEKRKDCGSATRFFYCAKASTSERNEGLDSLDQIMKNTHPTVKPVKLMRYLIRLITPPNGLVLDPYLGSGTTGVACIEEGFNCIGFELSEEYEPIIQGRLNKSQKRIGDFDG